MCLLLVESVLGQATMVLADHRLVEPVIEQLQVDLATEVCRDEVNRYNLAGLKPRLHVGLQLLESN